MSDLPAGVSLNPDAAVVEKLREVMAKNGGYCPCRLKRTPENTCICQEFKEQMADSSFEGFCHCHLYYKKRG